MADQITDLEDGIDLEKLLSGDFLNRRGSASPADGDTSVWHILFTQV